MATQYNVTPPSRFPIRQVTSLQDVLDAPEADVAYVMVDGDWLVIDTNEGDSDDIWYSICYGPTGSLAYNFYTTGNMVRSWKTVKGAARFIRKEGIKYSYSRWRKWIPAEELDKEAEATKKAYQAYMSRVVEAEQRLREKAAADSAIMDGIMADMTAAGIVDAGTVDAEYTYKRTFTYAGRRFIISVESE